LVPSTALGRWYADEAGRRCAGGRGGSGEFGGDDRFYVVDADENILWFQIYRL